MKVHKVLHILDNLEKYADKYVYLVGALVYEFEDPSICHWPKTEWGDKDYLERSIWLTCEDNLQFEDSVMREMSTKPVLVEGKIIAPDPTLGGCGHLSGWPAEIIATDIELYQRK